MLVKLKASKELQGNGDSHPVVSHSVQKLVEEVLAWQTRKGAQTIPSRSSSDGEERKLALRFAKMLLRRDKALGTEPSRSQLSPSEVSLVNSVPGVPLHGCAATKKEGKKATKKEPEAVAASSNSKVSEMSSTYAFPKAAQRMKRPDAARQSTAPEHGIGAR